MPTRGGVFDIMPGQQFKLSWLPAQLRVLGAMQGMIGGDQYWVDSGGGGANETDAGTFSNPFLTLTYAISQCSADNGDVIFAKAGHAETITAAIAANIAGVTIIGLGNGRNRPAFTLNFAGDGINVSADDVTLANLYFPASTIASVTSRINIGAGDCAIYGCEFLCGVNDLETITIEAAGDRAEIAYNVARVTANGPDAWVEIEAAGVDHLHIHDNEGDGGSDTNGWDVGFINSAVAHTHCRIHNNVNNFGPAIIFSAAATGVISNNYMGEGTLGSMLDPGSCMCFENYEADAIDESARLFPTGVAT
jgi:hypothetical protein